MSRFRNTPKTPTAAPGHPAVLYRDSQCYEGRLSIAADGSLAFHGIGTNGKKLNATVKPAEIKFKVKMNRGGMIGLHPRKRCPAWNRATFYYKAVIHVKPAQ